MLRTAMAFYVGTKTAAGPGKCCGHKVTERQSAPDTYDTKMLAWTTNERCALSFQAIHVVHDHQKILHDGERIHVSYENPILKMKKFHVIPCFRRACDVSFLVAPVFYFSIP